MIDLDKLIESYGIDVSDDLEVSPFDYVETFLICYSHFYCSIFSKFRHSSFFFGDWRLKIFSRSLK
uniref:hypothetical protein n=1 Tax=Caloranaerobacter azorensis TaxID=116090 RepID=UPI00258E4521